MVEDRRAAFCARLKSAREQKGVSLEEIAASTKISRSLLKGLEQNDLSRWPQGLYRRSYLREYLRAIDLPEESTMAEFVRLFPDGDDRARGACGTGPARAPGNSCALSMTLDDGRPERLARVRKRVTAAGDRPGCRLLVVWSRVVESARRPAGKRRGRRARLLHHRHGRARTRPRIAIAGGSELAPPEETDSLPAEPSLQDTLLERMREVKGLSGQPEPAMAGGILGMLIVTIIRTLFLR